MASWETEGIEMLRAFDPVFDVKVSLESHIAYATDHYASTTQSSAEESSITNGPQFLILQAQSAIWLVYKPFQFQDCKIWDHLNEDGRWGVVSQAQGDE
jgi:hypothetical protein